MRVAAIAASLAAVAAPSPTLRVVFPEGYSVRQMTDRVGAVRRIAITKRHVTPLLTGAGYAAAAASARPPTGFAVGRRSVEGFLFPSLYVFGPSTTGRERVGLQLAAFEREKVAPEERPLVAAVIYNRLAKGMPLAIDATLRYGSGFRGRDR